MMDAEFQNVTNLQRVRTMRALLDDLDPSVTTGPPIPDTEHAEMRRVLRAWDMNLVGAVGTLRQRRRGVTEK